MSYLFFDTETTGMWDFKAQAEAEHQPHLVQLGAILTSDDLTVQAEVNMLVNLDEGIEVTEGAAAIHGITNERMENFGLPLPIVLAAMSQVANKADVVVCHNWNFDSRVIRRSCAYIQRPNFLDRKRSFCTMEALTPVCKLPTKYGKYKWPKLQEAHEFFYGHQFEDAHDAMADIRATIKVFAAIQKHHPELLTRV